jgi:protein TonB
MSSATLPRINANDRLGMTLFLAVCVHVLLILGVGFDITADEADDKKPLPTMEITLVQSEDEEAPDRARLLAQANQRGGGSEREALRPGSPIDNPLPIPEQGKDVSSQMEAAPHTPRRPDQFPVLTVERSDSLWQRPTDPNTQPLDSKLTANQIQERKLELASISAEIRQLQEIYAQTEHEKTISANTREYKYAAYFDAWRAKVERIGNLNYPDEAKRGKISGSLLLDVAVRQDGSLRDVTVLHSSGHKVLDDAAVRIVKLAAPFAPFSKEVREDYNLLHITYTWRFDSRGRMQASP